MKNETPTGKETIAAMAAPKERRVILTLSQVEELGKNSLLLKHFIEVSKETSERSPIAFAMAKMLTKQKTIEQAIEEQKA